MAKKAPKKAAKAAEGVVQGSYEGGEGGGSGGGALDEGVPPESVAAGGGGGGASVSSTGERDETAKREYALGEGWSKAERFARERQDVIKRRQDAVQYVTEKLINSPYVDQTGAMEVKAAQAAQLAEKVVTHYALEGIVDWRGIDAKIVDLVQRCSTKPKGQEYLTAFFNALKSGNNPPNIDTFFLKKSSRRFKKSSRRFKKSSRRFKNKSSRRLKNKSSRRKSSRRKSSRRKSSRRNR